MSDIADDFLRADTATRLELARNANHHTALRELLGEEALNEYITLSQRLDADHLAVNYPPNLLFVPGVMGSLLDSTLGGVWWIDVRTRKHLNDLALSSDGTTDKDAANEVRAFNVDSSYEPFLLAARNTADIGSRTFPYDWRKQLTLCADQLVTQLEQMQTQNGGKPVHLVGHSMGGLMIRATLMKRPDLWPKLGRIIFIGTPHYGSPAIAGYLKNHLWGFDLMALLGLYLSRDTFRTLWGVLSMLPAPAGTYPGTRSSDKPEDRWHNNGDDYQHPCANFDLYNAGAWKLDLKPSETKQLQTVLDAARAFHEELAQSHFELSNDQRAQMTVIAGVGQWTLFRLEFVREFWGLWEHTIKVTEPIHGNIHRVGDGRVPLASAQLDYVNRYYVRGVHGGLPNIPAVYNAIFDIINERDVELATTPAQALSEHLAPSSSTSEAPHLDGTALPPSATGDDPGYLTDTRPEEHDDLTERLQQLDGKLNADELPQFTRIKLL
jgi:pimeloyl-ACP methyl ester carboxylesterase